MQPLTADDVDPSVGIRCCIKAFRDAKKAIRRSEKLLLAAHPSYDYVDVGDVTPIVCSAFMGLDHDPTCVHPNSVNGSRLPHLLRAFMVMESLFNAYVMIDDPDAFRAVMADEVEDILKASDGTHIKP